MDQKKIQYALWCSPGESPSLFATLFQCPFTNIINFTSGSIEFIELFET